MQQRPGMKALQLLAPRKTVLAEVPVPRTPPDGLLLKTRCVSICSTDISFYEGHLYPLSLGPPPTVTGLWPPDRGPIRGRGDASRSYDQEGVVAVDGLRQRSDGRRPLRAYSGAGQLKPVRPQTSLSSIALTIRSKGAVARPAVRPGAGEEPFVVTSAPERRRTLRRERHRDSARTTTGSGMARITADGRHRRRGPGIAFHAGRCPRTGPPVPRPAHLGLPGQP